MFLLIDSFILSDARPGALHLFCVHLQNTSKTSIVHYNSNALSNQEGGEAFAGDGRRKADLHTDCGVARERDH